MEADLSQVAARCDAKIPANFARVRFTTTVSALCTPSAASRTTSQGESKVTHVADRAGEHGRIERCAQNFDDSGTRSLHHGLRLRPRTKPAPKREHANLLTLKRIQRKLNSNGNDAQMNGRNR